MATDRETTIPLSKETRDRLKARALYGESYDGLIRKLLDATEPPAKTAKGKGAA
jgi:hypothetical protein